MPGGIALQFVPVIKTAQEQEKNLISPIESADFTPHHLRHKRGVKGLQKPELRTTVRKEDARFAQGQ